ncbi:circadian clock protein LdpA [Leptothoe spongobia]|uniref:4Fe-4S binding protein n=1 Tax=Leptothoe spongobia TAU-MAC 1115 TaxID=1967444 RepID=A0A947GH81_9CYAN|nr:LdpA C-terminal domain-containing domain [Leptothoe spongobia]MBT9315355.1 4Fe-4S binding protein [Leptothoe spongobia TAU-MAC 1115]
MTNLQNPLESLKRGQWFKLICGASYQDVAAIRNLSLVYGLAGADCIDVAADLAVVRAACEGIYISQSVASTGLGSRPWLMVSLNDGQDPHFRKAWFDGQQCPSTCLRPCERVCPADAILPIPNGKVETALEVLTERCYGCGRCLPVCPQNLIEEHAFTVSSSDIIPNLISYVDAIEIHTQVGRQKEFEKLWQQLSPYIPQLKLVAVSCPDHEPNSNAIVDYLNQLYPLMRPKPNQLLWQTDGRPMSGDIGKGTTRATIRLAQKVLNARLPGYVQLAGGTNNYTMAKLRSLNLIKESHQPIDGDQVASQAIHGIAYGSYARQLVNLGDGHLETKPKQLWHQVSLARDLVSQIKPDVHNIPHVSQFLKQQDHLPQASAATIPP